MDSHMDVNALSHLDTALPALLDFFHRLKQPHSHLASELIGQLLLCLLVCLGYLYLSGKVGEWVVRWARTRLNTPLSPEVEA
jgi:hypothetical protein